MRSLYSFVIFLVTLYFIPAGVASDIFLAQFAGQQTIEGENAIAVTFSKGVDSTQNLDTYLRIFKEDEMPVEGGWILSKDTGVAYFTNVAPETRYVIKIHKGLKSDSGEILAEGESFRVKTREVEPMISFGSKGFILASKLTRGLPVNSLNIPRADIDFFRIKPEALGQFWENFAAADQIYYYQSRDLSKSADLVYSGRWDFEIKKNLRSQVNIPITHIKELATPGIYFAVLKGAGVYEYGYSSTWFSISDLGLHVKKYPQLLQFHVQSLESAKPIKGARVEGVNKKGKILFSVLTDDGGIALAAGAFEKLTLVTATRKNHVSLLPMDVPAMDLSEFKMATEPFRPVDLFVYGPRDIYRPGEVVIIDGLLRNQDGRMTAKLPIKAQIHRPDGRMVHEFTWKPQNLNHLNYIYHLPNDAVTGRWRITFTHAGAKLKEYPFIVAEFLPERMKLAMENIDGQGDVLEKDQALGINLRGDFLYGAPASGSRADAMIHVKPARELFDKDWPGYEFGDTKNLLNHSFASDQIQLDDKGEGVIQVKNQWDEITSPHWVTANASLYDSGGRPVVRNKSWQIWPAESLVGIRSLSGDTEIKNDSLARFEVIRVDKEGKRLPAKNLKVTVIKEQRDYYWEFKNDAWQWGSSRQFYQVDQFSLDLGENGSGYVDIPVKWGGYRLEIVDPSTGLTTGVEIWAGWRQELGQGQEMNRPDRVDLVTDKKSYSPGDRVRVTVKAPEGGSGYLFVESDTNLLTLPVSIPAEGKTIEFTMNPSWQRHDLYLSALIVRPGESHIGESRMGNLPKRSVGLVPLPLDREDRKLALEIQFPHKIEPNRRVAVPVKVSRFDGTIPSEAWITLAAVDMGILNLTGFKTPSPFDYFFQARQYGVQIHDLYQKLIESNDGPWAKQRFGGDAPTLSRGGDRPSTDVQIVALHQQAVKVDSQGRADFFLDIPDFNGSLRLMAIGHTDKDFGSAEQEVTVASPLVTQITMPRFLSMGDKSQVALDVHNLTKIRQTLEISLDATSPIQGLGNKIHQVILEPNEKRVILMPVAAEQKLGRSIITCTIKGLVVEGEDRGMERRWFLETRPAFPVETRAWQRLISPGQSFKIGTEQMAPLLDQTLGIQASMGASPPINVAHHVAALDAYPYGCLEQTVSGLFPHVLLSGADFAALKLGTGTDKEKAEKIRLGIQRLVEKQKTSGGFGLWDSRGPEAPWLTAYALHFLINASDAGYAVPQTAVKRAMKRLLVYVRRPSSIPPGYMKKEPYRAAVRAYSAFVLARVQSLGLGDARSVYQYVRKHGKGSLGFVQAGIALSMAGDRHLAVKAFDQAIKTRRDPNAYYGDYGSNLRDFASSYYFLSTYFPEYDKAPLFLYELDAELANREWLSTQERNALVMAGSARLNAVTDPWSARVATGQETIDFTRDRSEQLIFAKGKSAGKFEILNTGNADLFVSVIMSGYPVQKPVPLSRGVTIRRRYLGIDGRGLEKSGSKPAFNSGERILVELTLKADKSMPHCLVVDMLPAGIELEDPSLSGSTLIDQIMVDKRSIFEWQGKYVIRHTEYRDDRFVAALDIRGKQPVRLFYLARVVSPGIFLIPPPLVEDMYRTNIRGVGDSPIQMKVTAP